MEVMIGDENKNEASESKENNPTSLPSSEDFINTSENISELVDDQEKTESPPMLPSDLQSSENNSNPLKSINQEVNIEIPTLNCSSKSDIQVNSEKVTNSDNLNNSSQAPPEIQNNSSTEVGLVESEILGKLSISGFKEVQAFLTRIPKCRMYLSLGDTGIQEGWTSAMTNVAYCYDCVPFAGWRKEVSVRMSGKTYGRIEIYFVPPEREKRFRSKMDIQMYLSRKNQSLRRVEKFDFKRVFCVCHTAEDNSVSYVECVFGKAGCGGWIHPWCVGLGRLSDEEISQLNCVICPLCAAYLRGTGELEKFIGKEDYLVLDQITVPSHIPDEKYIRDMQIEQSSTPHSQWGLIGSRFTFPRDKSQPGPPIPSFPSNYLPGKMSSNSKLISKLPALPLPPLVPQSTKYEFLMQKPLLNSSNGLTTVSSGLISGSLGIGMGGYSVGGALNNGSSSNNVNTNQPNSVVVKPFDYIPQSLHGDVKNKDGLGNFINAYSENGQDSLRFNSINGVTGGPYTEPIHSSVSTEQGLSATTNRSVPMVTEPSMSPSEQGFKGALETSNIRGGTIGAAKNPQELIAAVAALKGREKTELENERKKKKVKENQPNDSFMLGIFQHRLLQGVMFGEGSVVSNSSSLTTPSNFAKQITEIEATATTTIPGVEAKVEEKPRDELEFKEYGPDVPVRDRVRKVRGEDDRIWNLKVIGGWMEAPDEDNEVEEEEEERKIEKVNTEQEETEELRKKIIAKAEAIAEEKVFLSSRYKRDIVEAGVALSHSTRHHTKYRSLSKSSPTFLQDLKASYALTPSLCYLPLEDGGVRYGMVSSAAAPKSFHAACDSGLLCAYCLTDFTVEKPKDIEVKEGEDQAEKEGNEQASKKSKSNKRKSKGKKKDNVDKLVTEGWKPVDCRFGTLQYPLHRHCLHAIEVDKTPQLLKQTQEEPVVTMGQIYQYEGVDDAWCDLCGRMGGVLQHFQIHPDLCSPCTKPSGVSDGKGQAMEGEEEESIQWMGHIPCIQFLVESAVLIPLSVRNVIKKELVNELRGVELTRESQKLKVSKKSKSSRKSSVKSEEIKNKSKTSEHTDPTVSLILDSIVKTIEQSEQTDDVNPHNILDSYSIIFKQTEVYGKTDKSIQSIPRSSFEIVLNRWQCVFCGGRIGVTLRCASVGCTVRTHLNCLSVALVCTGHSQESKKDNKASKYGTIFSFQNQGEDALCFLCSLHCTS